MDEKFSCIDLTTCMADPNILLSKSLVERNIQDFRGALTVGAQPLALGDNHKSVFEEALQTPGCVEFVRECLRAGCNPNWINTYFNKAAINYAADSRDPQIIKAVLSHNGVNVDFAYSELTPLNSLAKALNQENIDSVVKCMQILLQYGASPNTPDQREMTPLHYIVQNDHIDELKKLEIIKLFLAQPDLDIDTYREGELRDVLAEMYPNLKVPVKFENQPITNHLLLTHIQRGDMEKFRLQFPAFQKFTKDDENLLLLIEAIKSGTHQAFDLIMDSGVDYKKKLADNNTPLEVAYVYGNWYALRKLLEQPDIKIDATDYPLSTIVRKLNESSVQSFCDYWKCFDVLLNSDKIDVNQMDLSRSTALHFAVKYRNKKAIAELLRKGADISIKNVFGELPIEGMHPEVLEQHFDSCISSNEFNPGEEQYEILIDFRNLRPEKKFKHRLKENMAPLAFMAKTKEFHHLLQHPVITSYLFLKWHKLLLIFYGNFLLYLFYALSGIAHVLLKFKLADKYSGLTEATYVTGLMTRAGVCLLTTREAIQFFISPNRYIRSFTNLMEIILIIMSVLICTDHYFDHDIQRKIAVVTILLATVELCLVVGSLPVPSISTHILMLEAVCKSFLKSFLFYSLFVITFSLCFYIMSDTVALGETNDFTAFANPAMAFSKTIVMLTGEFDASDLNFEYFNMFLFLTFVFFMTIIMFNLLNGLAVSDTQVIKAQAELNFIICRTQLLTRYEELFIERSKQTQTFCQNHCLPFRRLAKYWGHLFPDYSTGSQITIFPNESNRILLPKKIYEQNGDNRSNTNISLTTGDEKVKRPNALTCCLSFIFGKCTKIDNRTVQLAMAILERKSEPNIENRLNSMEQKLEKILERLSQKTS